MTSLEQFIDRRNRDLLGDVAIKGGLGLVFSVATFGFVWWITFLLVASSGRRPSPSPWLALAITGVYFAAATWSALRGVQPLSNLAPLTARERGQREVEDAVREVVGAGPAIRAETVSGLASCLIAGPAGVVGGWQAWRRRLTLDPAVLAEAEALLARAPAPVEGRARGALALVHLGLATLEVGDDGAVRARLTAKGKQVAGA